MNTAAKPQRIGRCAMSTEREDRIRKQQVTDAMSAARSLSFRAKCDEAWWFDFARGNVRDARRAFEAAVRVEKLRGAAWRRRRAAWFGSALDWLLMAIDAREYARSLRRSRLARGQS